jgi:hypothetical protein
VRQRSFIKIGAALLVGTLALTACGSRDDDTPGSTGGNTTGATGGATEGGISAGGAAADLCADVTCDDDNDPCTEDECDPATGKCGIPRTGTVCDDGKYCNGPDLCDAGKCTDHTGSPCTGTCDEAADFCECATKDDCHADEPGVWSDCVFASECANTGKQTRAVTKFICNAEHSCTGTAMVEEQACTRVTVGNACTSDNKRCDGAETCNAAGNCVSDNVNPCTGNPAATKYCSEANAQCGACSGNAVQGAYPGCASAEFCCYNQAAANAWACQSTKCPLIIKTAISTTKLTTTKFETGAAP